MTKIEWVQNADGSRGKTWNPTRGCTRISEGCRNCYAERMAARGLPAMNSPTTGEPFAVMKSDGPHWTGKVELIPEMLDIPLRRRKPTTWFVNSMSDLFHEDLPDEDIYRVFAAMALTYRMWCDSDGNHRAPLHQFQVLTKRAARMRDLVSRIMASRWVEDWFDIPAVKAAVKISVDRGDALPGNASIPVVQWFADGMPGLWLGVSVEDQKTADGRIPLLLQTPAAMRFLSCEPLLGPVDIGLHRWVRLFHTVVSELPFPPVPYADKGIYRAASNRFGALSVPAAVTGGLLGIKPGEFERLPILDWCIVGGESGPGARPCDLAWIRSIVAQCKEAGVACFVKQLGANVTDRNDAGFDGDTPQSWPMDTAWSELDSGYQGAPVRVLLDDRKGGDPAEWPADLRVREMP